ncbi:hypothetical protein T439DRAFT_328380 [Meredithblackwellia eburnea MCA 4105]
MEQLLERLPMHLQHDLLESTVVRKKTMVTPSLYNTVLASTETFSKTRNFSFEEYFTPAHLSTWLTCEIGEARSVLLAFSQGADNICRELARWVCLSDLSNYIRPREHSSTPDSSCSTSHDSPHVRASGSSFGATPRDGISPPLQITWKTIDRLYCYIDSRFDALLSCSATPDQAFPAASRGPPPSIETLPPIERRQRVLGNQYLFIEFELVKIVWALWCRAELTVGADIVKECRKKTEQALARVASRSHAWLLPNGTGTLSLDLRAGYLLTRIFWDVRVGGRAWLPRWARKFSNEASLLSETLSLVAYTSPDASQLVMELEAAVQQAPKSQTEFITAKGLHGSVDVDSRHQGKAGGPVLLGGSADSASRIVTEALARM